MFEEVRVPLKSLTLGIKLLSDSSRISHTDKETVTMIRDASNFMNATLNDVLSMHKIEEGNLVIEYRPFVIADLVFSIKDKFR